MHLHQLFILKNCTMEFVNRRVAPFTHSGEKWKARTKSRSEMPVWTVSQRFSHLQWRRLFKELWSRPTTTADFWSPFWQVPCTSDICLLKIRFKTEVCTCSQFPTEAMQWIREVEMVDSVDELRSSSSTRGISMPNFEVLDVGIASALNKIIHNSHFNTSIILRNKKPRSRTVSFVADRLPTWSTNNSGSLESMILSKTMPTNSLLVYEMMIFRNSFRNGTKFHYLWRKSHLMTSWKDCTN